MSARKVIYEVARRLNSAIFPPITQLELVHTEGCNLACKYCFEKEMLGYKKMPSDIALAAVDLLFDYSADQTELQITHFGGEPTLNFSGIRVATEYAQHKAAESGKSVRIDMTTNGMLLNEEMVQYFADHEIYVLLSIDGMEESHNRYRVDKAGRGSFSRVLKGLSILKTRQAWIGAKMTVMPENAKALYGDVRGLHDLGINQFIIGHATGVEWPQSAIEEYGKQLAEVIRWYRAVNDSSLRINDHSEDSPIGGYFGCQAARSSIAVSVLGEISPCSKLMGIGPSRQLVAKLGDVWHGLTHVRNRESLTGCVDLQSACHDLGIDRDYQGGCFAVNLSETGDLFRPSLVEHEFSLLERSVCIGCPGSGH
jgi:uncharacterized protein